ncbi:N-acetyl-D-Glu racemase DgcA [Terrihabitans rhizophilus]|uniref:Dipeptide epimerase n=1 Tax=Terrihabitans rhizophilus TaxID=3092662 RepID=A0ABU4RR05_9HYPH|nr:N-acetyl-D-Glu racemase DgcA [Terrihabitans sp. PJ23]MDX6807041.1 N-acetyl-D-Glu racemase DgcA [Terrihabitans sp. PJ23]
MARHLLVEIESWPIAGRFTISRGSRTEAVVVVARLEDGGLIGRGECVPYARYGESVESVAAAINAMADAVAQGLTRADLQAAMPAGAARNALDCALWDLEAKTAGAPAWRLAGLAEPRTVETAYTISLGSPEEMAEAAARAAARPLLKVKLGQAGDAERIAGVRQAAPNSRLVVDANEGWTPENLAANAQACADAGVELIEQPLPAADDTVLADFRSPVAICADESVHSRQGLEALRGRYDAINIKLDKTGGLTEALALAAEAERLGFGIMMGCMVGTSLAMAPAMLLAGRARFVDLDGPLLLARDRMPGLNYTGSLVSPPDPDLWG